MLIIFDVIFFIVMLNSVFSTLIFKLKKIKNRRKRKLPEDRVRMYSIPQVTLKGFRACTNELRPTYCRADLSLIRLVRELLYSDFSYKS